MRFPPLCDKYGLPSPYVWVPGPVAFAAATGCEVGLGRHMGLLEVYSRLSLLTAELERSMAGFATGLV